MYLRHESSVEDFIFLLQQVANRTQVWPNRQRFLIIKLVCIVLPGFQLMCYLEKKKLGPIALIESYTMYSESDYLLLV